MPGISILLISGEKPKVSQVVFVEFISVIYTFKVYVSVVVVFKVIVLVVLSNRNKSFCKAISCSCSGENENRFLRWRMGALPVTLPEMKKFLGLVILMGIIYKPSIPLYWSTDELFSTLIFRQLMTRNRFQLIEKFLHFNNNVDPNYDPLDENRDRLH